MKSLRKKEKKDISADALIEQGMKALSSLQPELAASFFQRALTLEPKNTNIMDGYADVLLQLGQMDEALQLLQSSISLNPEENCFKWLFLAQLQCGLEALATYSKGIEIITNHISNLSDDSSIEDAKKQLAKAYCSIAELYLTDLCYEDNAESSAEAAVNNAFSVIPDLIDANQTLASIRLSQSRPEEACALIASVFDRVMIIRDKIHARTVMDELSMESDQDDYKELPEPEFCIATAKILIECGDTNKAYNEKALELISDLLEDDDDNIELWYIAGVACLSLSPPDLGNARYHLDRAKEMIDAIREQCQANEEVFTFDDQYKLITDHIVILQEMEKKRDNGEDVEGMEHSGRSISQRRRQIEEDSATDMQVHDEEEWSSCDEDEEDTVIEEDS